MRYKISLLNSRKLITVSRQDYCHVKRLRWSLTKEGYAISKDPRTGRVTGIAPFILGTPAGMIADHRNGDKLDNTRRNIRNCTTCQSAQNRKGWTKKTIPYKGVHLDRKRRKYRAIITANGVRKQSPRFDSPRDAALAYDKMAREMHGWFARTNFL